MSDRALKEPPASTSSDRPPGACTSVASACPTSRKLSRIQPAGGRPLSAGRDGADTIQMAATASRVVAAARARAEPPVHKSRISAP